MIKSAEQRRASLSDLLRRIPTRLLQWTLQGIVVCLFSRARLVGELAPFAPACMSAGLMCRWSPWAMLLGSAVGSLTSGRTSLDLAPLISCALVELFFITLRLFVRRDHDGIYPMQDFLASCMSGASVLLPGLLFSGGIAYNLITAALSGTVAALLAPSLISAMGVRPRRRLLMPDEQLSLALFLLLMLISLRAVPYAGERLSTAAAVFATLCLSSTGAGMGAMCGVACGSALSLGGSDPFLGATLSLCGLLAGCVRALPRPVAALTFMLGSLLTISWGLGYTIGALEFGPMLAGSAIYCLLPIKFLRKIRGWTQPTRPQADPERMAIRMRRSAGRRLEELSEVFGELADGYHEEPSLPNDRQLIASLRSALCDGCESYAACWQGESAQAGRLLCRLIAQAISGRPITPTGELPPDLLRHCRRSAQIDRRLLPPLRELAEQRRQELRRGESRGLLSRQFRQAQNQLMSLATRMKSPCCLDEQYASLAASALDRAGLPVSELIVVVDDAFEIIAVPADGVWSASAARRAAALLSDELGIPFSPALNRGRIPDECELRLLQAPALTASIGSASRPSTPGQPCGDSFFARVLPDGRLLIALSDGMGSGESAAAESRRCVSLLRKFVCAGLDRESALNAANSLLMLRSGEDMFATVDLCVVDLRTGSAAFSKLGACSSYLLREKRVIKISGGRLPLGVLDRVEAETRREELYPGDMIVMFSDGIADELRDGEIEWLEEQLPALRRLTPEQAADRLLSLSAARRSGTPDDMTVVTARILARPIRKS